MHTKASAPIQGHLENEKISWLAFAACFIVYVVFCMTRNTYSAAIAAIVQEGLFTKANAGVINSAFYLLYGSAQFVGGYMADRVSPYKIIIAGLIGGILTNAAMALSNSFLIMLIAWSLNGLAQFGVWPAILAVVARVVMNKHQSIAMSLLPLGFCTGSMISYLNAMVVLEYSSWPNLFWVSVSVLILSTCFFLFAVGKIRRNMVPDKNTALEASAGSAAECTPTAASDQPVSDPAARQNSFQLFPMLLSSGLLFLIIPNICRSMLDLGLKTWVPTMLTETFGITAGFASFLTVLLLLVNLTGVFLVNAIYPNRCKNTAIVIALFFAASLPLLCLMFSMNSLSVLVVVALLAVVTTFMNACNQLFNVILPVSFKRFGKVGIVAGTLNAFACFGILLSNLLYGWLAEHFGWNTTITVWVVLAAVAVILSLIAAPRWKRFALK